MDNVGSMLNGGAYSDVFSQERAVVDQSKQIIIFLTNEFFATVYPSPLEERVAVVNWLAFCGKMIAKGFQLLM